MSSALERDAIKLNVSVRGSDGLALVFIHGFGEGAYVWEGVFDPPLPYRSISIDLRGHGDSPWDPALRYGLEDHVRDVAAELQALALPRIVVVGHSMGATIALRLAAILPEVCSLVLVDPSQAADRRAIEQIALDFEYANRTFESAQAYARWLSEARPLVTGERAARVAAKALRRRSDGSFELKRDPGMLAARRGAAPSEPWAALAKTVVPILIVRGAMSAMLAASAASEMARAAPRGRLATVPMAGHGVMLDNPGAFRSSLIDFLERDVVAAAGRSDPHRRTPAFEGQGATAAAHLDAP